MSAVAVPISSAERLLFDDDPPLNFSFSSSNAVTTSSSSSQIYCKLGGIHTFNHGDDDDEKFLIAIFFVMHDIGLARCSSQLLPRSSGFNSTPHTKSNRIKLASTARRNRCGGGGGATATVPHKTRQAKQGRPKIASEIIP